MNQYENKYTTRTQLHSTKVMQLGIHLPQYYFFFIQYTIFKGAFVIHATTTENEKSKEEFRSLCMKQKQE